MKINKAKLRKAFNLNKNLTITPSWVGNGHFMMKRFLLPEFDSEASIIRFFKADANFRGCTDEEVKNLHSTEAHQITMTSDVYSRHFGDPLTCRKYLDEAGVETWLNETYAGLFEVEIARVCGPRCNVVDNEIDPSFIIAQCRAPK